MFTTFLAFLAGWGLSLINDRRHKIHNLKDSYKSLLYELKEQKKYLDNRTKKTVDRIADEGIIANSMYIGISRYDSLIYSGMFRQLDYNVQDLAVQVYGRIKIVNRSSTRITEMILYKTGNSSQDFIEQMHSMGTQVDKHMDEIKSNIPKLIKLVEDRMSTSIF